MAHFVRTELDATWISGYVVVTTDWISLDAKIAAGVNGIVGGCWAPSSQMQILGSGLQVTGQATVWGVDGILKTTSGARVQFGDSDFAQLASTHTGRSRTIVSDMLMAIGNPFNGITPDFSNLCTQAIAQSVLSGTVATPVSFSVPLRVHDGATLSSVTIGFKVGTQHANVPLTMPKFRIVRADANGNLTYLTSSASGADVNGYVSPPTPASGSAWYNNGFAQSITITCDQNNIIAISTYTYWVDVIEEQGLTGYPWQIGYLSDVGLVGVSNVIPNGTQTVDGISSGTVSRILLTAQNDPQQNGIWQPSTSAPWIRTADMNQLSQFVQGLVVGVTSGNSQAGSTWQLGAAPTTITGFPYWAATTAYKVGQTVVPSAGGALCFVCSAAGTSGGSEPAWPTTPGATIVDGAATWTAQIDPGSPIVVSPFVALGNSYLHAVAQFTNIADTRWQ